MNSAIKTGVVPRFRGDYFFLSNHDTHEEFKWRGRWYNSGEKAFAHAKTFYCDNPNRAVEIADKIMASMDPKVAKQLGSDRAMALDLNVWNAHKVQIMREIVHAKFQGVTGYGGRLINTGAMMLVEGNDWGDTFWGRSLDKDTGKMVGYNTLGVILMEERGLWLRG